MSFFLLEQPVTNNIDMHKINTKGFFILIIYVKDICFVTLRLPIAKVNKNPNTAKEILEKFMYMD